MGAIFLQGNSRDVLQNLPADYFHVACTSPPYYGLRLYEGGQEIWDGDKDKNCQHEWGNELTRRDRGSAKGANAVVGNQLREVSGIETRQGSFCSKCGAWRGQLGGEPTPGLYISHLVEICKEVKRVLRPDGVFWLNIGDSWAGGKGQSGGGSPESQAQRNAAGESINRPCDQLTGPKQTRALDDRAALRSSGIKPLDMVLIPSHLAIALRVDGWYVRSMVCWSKSNPMPEPVNGWRYEKHRIHIKPRTRGSNEGSMPPQSHHPGQVPHRDGSFDTPSDTEWVDCPGCSKCSPNDGYILRTGSWRPTDSYEFILMLTKTDSYYCDREAVLEQGVYPAGESRQGGNGHKSLFAGSRTTERLHNKDWVGNGGRNLRSVWEFPTAPFNGKKLTGSIDHFAVYPPKLVEVAVKSSTSEKGCCPECGAPWARVVNHKPAVSKECPKTRESHEARGGIGVPVGTVGKSGSGRIEGYTTTTGWRPTCSCQSSEPVPCRVLDPFSGAGTTALVCERLGLDSFSMDTSAEYIALSKARLAEDEEKRITEFITKAKKRGRNDE